MRYAMRLIGYGLIGCALIGCCLCLVGCGGSSDQIVDDVAQKDGSKPAAPKMSKVEAYLPPLDGGRVQIAPPAGWHTLPRKAKYLVRFTRKKGVSSPAILVTVKPFEEIGEVTTKNVKKYAKLLDDPGDNVQLRRIDRFVAVSYTKQGTLKDGLRTTLLDRKILDTVVDHRRYQFELRAKEGSLDRFLPDLMAVAVNTQFMNREGVETLEDLDAEEVAEGGAEAKSTEKTYSANAFDSPAPKVKSKPAKTEPKAQAPKAQAPKAQAPKAEAAKTQAKPKRIEKTTKESEKKKPAKKKSRRRRTSEFD